MVQNYIFIVSVEIRHTASTKYAILETLILELVPTFTAHIPYRFVFRHFWIYLHTPNVVEAKFISALETNRHRIEIASQAPALRTACAGQFAQSFFRFFGHLCHWFGKLKLNAKRVQDESINYLELMLLSWTLANSLYLVVLIVLYVIC